MAKKSNEPKEDKIELASLLTAIDNKNIEWWQSLSAGQQKTFSKSAWTFMRFLSSSNSRNYDLDVYYLRSINEKLNKRFNSIKTHPLLQFLTMIEASPGPEFGKTFHPWIAPISRPKSKNENLWKVIYPDANEQELEILNQVNTTDDLIQYLKDMGWSDKDIKQHLSDHE